MLITNTITMAIDRQQMSPVIDAVQGEKNSRSIKINLTNGGEPWIVPQDASCVVHFGNSNKIGGAYDTLDDGTSAVEIGENYIKFTLAKQVVSSPGDTFVQVEIAKNNISLSTFTVVVRVQADPSLGAIDSDDYFNFTEYISREIEEQLKGLGNIPNANGVSF